MKVVKVLEEVEALSALSGKRQRRRVVILERDDGHFSLEEEYFYTSVHDGEIVAQGWAGLGPRGIFASPEIAEAEGRSYFLQTHKK